MTISHTEITDNKILKDKKVSLRAVSKKYPVVNTRSVFNEYVGIFGRLRIYLLTLPRERFWV